MAGHAQEQPTLYYLSFPIESQLLAVCGNPIEVNCNFDLPHRYNTTAKYSRFRSRIAILGAAGELFVPNKGFASFRLKIYIADGINE